MPITPQVKEQLIARALKIRTRAYAPYSKYNVGASLLTDDGEIVDGVNVENAVYSVGICAERNAVFQAIVHGHRSFRAIAVATDNGGSPCGSCRQVLAEFGRDIEIYTVDSDGKVILETTVKDLLPEAFGPEYLPKKG
ncbi:MAG: cytidine deaminase [Anaerolineales bacterium]|nr:MAG: cytidine deaminase [Anaerolineales bacterium]